MATSAWSTEAWTDTQGVWEGDFTYLLDARQFPIGGGTESGESYGWTWDRETVCDDTHAKSFGKSFMCRRSPGLYPSQGWTEWGVDKSIGKIYEGGILHVQYSAYFENDFKFEDANPALKFGRIATYKADGNSGGYLTIMLENYRTGYADGTLGAEISVAPTWHGRFSGNVVAVDKWETFEMEVKFHSVAGQGWFRIWHRQSDGVYKLVVNKTTYPTLPESGGYCDKFMIFGGTWNSTEGDTLPTTTQYVWIDNVIIEPDQSKITATDANGFKIIGDAI